MLENHLIIFLYHVNQQNISFLHRLNQNEQQKQFCIAFQNTGISSHGVDVLLSSSVSKVINRNKSPKPDAKCQISCLSKNNKVHSAFKCRDSDGLIRVVFSWNPLKNTNPAPQNIRVSMMYTQHVKVMDSRLPFGSPNKQT